MLFIQVALIFCNAVFACAEIAVISMNETRLTKLMEQGKKKAGRLKALKNEPAKFLATIQVAITLSGFLGSAFAADNFSDPFVDSLISMGVKLPKATLDTIAVILITLLLSYLTLIFGELVPKRLAMAKAENMALKVSGLVYVVAKVFSPIVWLLTASTNGVLRLLGLDPNEEEEELNEEEIRLILEERSQSGAIAPAENEIIQKVFEFNDISVGEVATHRTELSVLWLEESDEEWEETIKQKYHTYYPVCDDTLDHMIGILDTKEYFRLTRKERKEVLAKAVNQPFFVPEVLKADMLFQNMKETKCFFAVVLDEYGGVEGIVTIHDLIEQLLGKFITRQPGGQELTDIEPMDSATWLVRGSATLDELETTLKVTFPNQGYDTFNGFVFYMLGKVPEDGARLEFEYDTLLIQIKEIKNHKVEKAIVHKK